MKASALLKTFGHTYQTRKSLFLTGSPGIGKSEIVAQFCAEEKMELRDIRAVLLDPVDLRGLPRVTDGRTIWAHPEFLPRDGKGVLFFDELDRAPNMVQNSCLQIINPPHQLGEYTLPPGWTCFAAGNGSTDRLTSKMSDAMRSRFLMVTMEVDAEDWCRWAIKAGISTVIIAFLQFQPKLLHDYKRDAEQFPCPRQWKAVDDFLKTKPGRDIEHEIYSGLIGKPAAIEFLAFMKVWRELPSPKSCILNPETEKVPSDSSTLYALAGALANLASEENFDSVAKYAARMPPEFDILLTKIASARQPKIKSTRAFIEWGSRHSSVLI